jgi:hypothetical protein
MYANYTCADHAHRLSALAVARMPPSEVGRFVLQHHVWPRVYATKQLCRKETMWFTRVQVRSIKEAFAIYEGMRGPGGEGAED